MAVPEFFNTIEQTGLSQWIRFNTDSHFGFYFILLCHTIGLSLLVGANAVVDMRLLGVGSALPLKPMKQLFGFMFTGLGINIATGLLLLTAYPTKALTDWDFYIKMTFVTLGVVTMFRIYYTCVPGFGAQRLDMIARGQNDGEVLSLFLDCGDCCRPLAFGDIHLHHLRPSLSKIGFEGATFATHLGAPVLIGNRSTLWN